MSLNWDAYLILDNGKLCIELVNWNGDYPDYTIVYEFTEAEVDKIRKWCNYKYANKYTKPKPIMVCDQWEILVHRNDDKYFSETETILEGIKP